MVHQYLSLVYPSLVQSLSLVHNLCATNFFIQQNLSLVQPLISTHFFLQKLTFFCCSGEYLGFFEYFVVRCHHLSPFFSPFSLPNTSVEATQSKTFLIFQRCQVCTSCQPINTFKLSNHCPAHSVKRDCINLLNVHWNRQLQLEVSIKIHLLFLHTL